MGHIHQDVQLIGDKPVVVRMLVDTGSTYSIVPAALARALGVARHPRRVSVAFADGRRARYPFGTALFRIGDREAAATILFGNVAEPILGVEALEALGLTVDSRRQRLKPSRGYAARV